MNRLTRLIAELKRRGVLQLAAAYGATAFVVMEGSEIVLPRIGFGDDVVTFVVWAALTGFPLALAFAWFYNVRPEGASQAQPLPDGPPSPSKRSTAGRRWLVAGAAAVGTVVFLTSAWFVLQRRVQVVPIGPGAAGAAAVAVLPFEVRAHPDYRYLGNGMVDLMTTRIEGTGNATPIPARAVMGLVEQEGGRLDAEARRRIATELGAGRFIDGVVVEAGGRLSVSAALIDPATGDEVASTTVEGTEAELFSMVDDLTRGLVANVASNSGARLIETAALTTDSLSALKAYLRGQTLLRDGQFTSALAAFEEASAIDPTFALAYYRESVAREWGTQNGATEAAERAAELSDRLSERDRQLVEAMLAWRYGDADRAEAIYRTILGTWPDDVESWLQLAEVLNHAGPLKGWPIGESRQAFERVLRYEPDHLLSLWHLARIDALEGRFEDAAEKVRRIEALSPEGDRTLELSAMLAANADSAAWRATLDRLYDAQDITRRATAWNVAVFGGQIERALEAAGAMTEADRAPEVRATGHLVQAAYAIALGRIEEARVSVRRVADLDPGMALAYGGAFDLLPFRTPDRAALEGRREQLLSWAPDDGCVSPHPVRTYQPLNCARPVVRLYLLGLIEAQLGMNGDAEARVAALEDRIAQGDRPRQIRGFATEIQAELAWAAGDVEGAVAVFDADPGHVWYMEALQSLFHSYARGRFRRAQALEQVGRLEEAARWYRSFGEEADLDLVYLAPGLVGRGRVLEALGQDHEAVQAYGRAAELLSDGEDVWADLAEEARVGAGGRLEAPGAR
jgi:tetratricopeptide (TPR) repeat protein